MEAADPRAAKTLAAILEENLDALRTNQRWVRALARTAGHIDGAFHCAQAIEHTEAVIRLLRGEPRPAAAPQLAPGQRFVPALGVVVTDLEG